MASRKIVALIGSTASGKSDLALEIAATKKAHIVSCDSLLVYKDLNIGTAKPTAQELASVPHYGVNLVTANEPFTAGDYVKLMRPIIDDLWAKDVPILIVGGTGFYLKALLFGVWDAPPTQPELRKRIEESVAHLPEEERGVALHKLLSEKDPQYATKISPNDVYRVIRALEIIEVTGNTVTARLSQTKLQNPLPYPFRVFGIRRSQRDLERRIVERTNQMFAKGLVTETRGLIQNYPEIPKPLRSVGYAEVLDHFDGKMTLAECRERVVISTRQLAKKQRTFFKTFPGIEWFDLPASEDILKGEIFGCL